MDDTLARRRRSKHTPEALTRLTRANPVEKRVQSGGGEVADSPNWTARKYDGAMLQVLS